MKKIICMLLLTQGGIMMAQTETVATVNGKKITINTNPIATANNGLTAASGNIQLGGALTQPSVLTTTSAFTLALKGLQTGLAADKIVVTDANGVLKMVDQSSITGVGDNLGNHIATTDLNMSSKNVNNVAIANIATGNINTANITYAASFKDRLTTNTSDFVLFKQSGVLGIYNSKNGRSELLIDEITGKTTVTSAAISKGTDGVVPAAGYVATSADAAGNIVWKAASTLAVAGDNLGNHIATQDLAMSAKNITGATNVTATGTVTGANLTATTKTVTPAAQITTGAGLGKVAVSDATGNVTWTDAATIAGKGDNLGNHIATQDLAMSAKNITGATNVTATGTVTGANLTATTKTVTPAAQITTGAGLGKVAVSDAAGNVTWTDAATIAAKGDDLGNHIATTDLNMSSKNINNVAIANIATGNITTGNITTANITYAATIKDRYTTNTEDFTLFKNNGVFGLYNSKNKKNELAIDEVTGKTMLTSAQIVKGTDGLAPATGYVATSADAAGNIVWKAASTLAVSGDNLGNHIATQDLAMSAKNITGATNVTATGTVTAANLTATTKTVTPAAQITTGAGLGKVALSDAAGNVVWTDPATMTTKGDNLGNHIATQTLSMNTNIIDFTAQDNKKIQFLGTPDGARIEHAGGFLLSTISGLKTTPNSGQFNWSNYGVAGAQTELMNLKGTGLTVNGKTTSATAQITTGAGLGKIAVSDAAGNVTWTDATTIAAKGDNLGNHIATQDLAMSAKNITGATNVTATGTVTGANLTATTKTVTPAAQITTGAGLGKVALSDAAGNVVWTDPATMTTKGDNLGNHIATTDLNMSSKNINNVAIANVATANITTGNIGVANILTGATIKDRITTNANDFTLYKNAGVFGLYNSKNSRNELSIDETTGKTTLTSAQITTGAGLGKIAVSDAAGNVTWTDATTIAAKGDNLGNHIATQDLAMSAKNITGAANITATGIVAGANLTATTKTVTPAAQITTGAGAGKIAVSDATGNVTWTDAATIAAKGDNLGNHTATQDLAMSAKNITGAANITATATVTSANITATTKTTTNTLQVSKGTNGVAPTAGSVLTAVDVAGNAVWVKPQDFGNIVYTSISVAPGATYNFNLLEDPLYSNYTITSSNGCSIPMVISLVGYGNGIVFVGGQAGIGSYTTQILNGYSTSIKFTAMAGSCADGQGTGNDQYNVTISKLPNVLTITNNGSVPKVYQVRQRLN